MNFCADDVNSCALDELAAVRKVHGELSAFCEEALAEVREEAVAARPARRRVHRLQDAVRALTAAQFVDSVTQADAEIEAVEKKPRNTMPCNAFAIHTGAQPLSMYATATWAMCFPHLFPLWGWRLRPATPEAYDIPAGAVHVIASGRAMLQCGSRDDGRSEALLRPSCGTEA